MRRLAVLVLMVLLAGLITACGSTAVSATATPDVAQPPATPTAAYGSYIGIAGYGFVMTEAVGGIAAGTRVRLASAYYDGTHTIYSVVAAGEVAQADAREDQVTFAADDTPDPTPTEEPLLPSAVPTAPTGTAAGALGGYVGMGGYPLITTEAVPPVDAGARVRISHVYVAGDTLLYGIVAEDEQTIAMAREDQLAVAPPADE